MKKFVLMLCLPLAAVGMRAQERGLGNPHFTYIEKGTFTAGISGAYHGWNAGNGMDFLGILTETDGKIARLTASAHCGWFFRDNLSLIATVKYTNTAVDGNTLKVSSLVDVSNKHTRSEMYTASVGVRKYVPLFNSKILALYGEGRLSGDRGYSKSYSETERGKEGRYTDLYSVNLGVIAGISVFISDRLSIRASLPTVSVGYGWQKQIKDQVKRSSFSGLTLSYTVDILGLEFGTSFLF